MDKKILDKLEEIENSVEELRKGIDNSSYNIKNIENKVQLAIKEAKKAQQSANDADSSGSTWFFGILIVLTLAFIFNPTHSNHYEFLNNRGLSPSRNIIKRAYKNYYVFSIIDINDDKDDGNITFGLFGKVFALELLKKVEDEL